MFFAIYNLHDISRALGYLLSIIPADEFVFLWLLCIISALCIVPERCFSVTCPSCFDDGACIPLCSDLEFISFNFHFIVVEFQANSSNLCCVILDSINNIYHSDPANYFILESQHTLSQFAEKIYLKFVDVQVRHRLPGVCHFQPMLTNFNVFFNRFRGSFSKFSNMSFSDSTLSRVKN